MWLILSLLHNFAVGVAIIFVVAFLLTLLLNPTATPKEVFEHWEKIWKNG